MLIDSHCHLLKDEYEDNKKIIDNSKQSGIDKLIINAYDLKTSHEVVELSKLYDYVYPAIGIGPENVNEVNESDIKIIRELCINNKITAIGEIGLDYYWTKENKEKQLYVFEEMLKIASDYNLPVIVHNRCATLDVINLLKKYKVTGIMHCFSGSIETANELIKMGFLIGIGGVVTFKNAKEIKEIVSKVDISNISLETDSPYLAPDPLRGTKNVPKNLTIIAEKIAEIKGINTSVVIDQTGLNVVSKFDL